MLSHLHVRHFAIIDDVSVELDDGMTALTGETGAGKSILLGALGLVLGERASALGVQEGATRAEIAASFRLDALPDARAWLARHELDVADEEECVLRRTVSSSGKSRATINGTPVSVAMLGELGGRLVGVHGQHAHQTLGRAAEQRRLLDAWSAARAAKGGRRGDGRDAMLEAVRDAHAAWVEADARHREALEATRARAERVDLLRFQLQEFDELDVGATPIADIESEHRWLANVERLRELGTEALGALDGESGGASETAASASAALGRALAPLGELAAIDERLREALDLVESASIQSAEAASVLRGRVGALEHDESRLAWLDATLGKLHALARKHFCEVAELGAVEERLRGELDALTSPATSVEALANARDARLADYLERAKKLGARRRRDAKRLATLVTEAMGTLAMDGGRFVVDIESDPDARSAQGLDTVTFLVSPNPGIAPAPLSRIASGGELSRIGLCLQLATSDARAVPTLIFDEVDAGIGGAVAETVGRLLREVGRSAQVLCVTHLPQVAAQAHRHLRVSKRVVSGRTRTTVEPLAGKAKREEIARMLGGAKITERSRRHAQEMLDGAH